MKVIKKLLIIVLIILVTAESFVAIYLYQNPNIIRNIINQENLVYYSTKTELDFETEKITAIAKQPKDINDLFIAGWIPDWDLADGFATAKQYEGYIDSLSPFWLLPQEDASLKEVGNKTNPEILTYVSTKNIELIPTIPLFEADLFNKILKDNTTINKFITEIINRIDKYNYDGIDLDFESIKLEDKKRFFTFLENISTKLKAKNKKLVFTAMPKWGDAIYYPSLPQTRKVQDYKKIADLVDEFRLMTYDFFGRETTEAGPVAPLEWMERVVQYAIYVGVPREKIVLGIPTYAYDWSDRPLTSKIDLINWYGNLANIQNLDGGDAYYYKAVESVISKYNMTYQFNEIWGEAVGRYEYQGKQRIVIFPTSESIRLRKQLAADYGIKGVAFWRLGDEGGLKL